MFAYMCTQLGHGDMCNCRGTQGLSTKRTNMTATTPSMYVCMYVCLHLCTQLGQASTGPWLCEKDSVAK